MRFQRVVADYSEGKHSRAGQFILVKTVHIIMDEAAEPGAR